MNNPPAAATSATTSPKALMPVDEALARLLALAPAPQGEWVDLRRAAGRVLLQSLQAERDQPPFAASAMDGYAIAACDHTPGARLHLVGESAAGKAWPGRLRPGQALRIFTGAPVPEGCERIVLQEDVSRDGDLVILGARLDGGMHIRAQGQDFRAGETLSAPRRLRPVDLMLAAAMNQPRLFVARRPELALMATGDELVMPGEAPRPDQIIASNGFAIAALAEACGARLRLLPIARDNPESLAQGFALARGADLLVTIGGASVGDHDLVGDLWQAMGAARSFWKIAMRPGKPLMAGRAGDMLLLGLPGNPVSALVCSHLFLAPLLARMQGLSGGISLQQAVLAKDEPANGPRAHYMRAQLLPPESPGALPRIASLPSQDSSQIRLLTEASALLIRPIGDPARPAGSLVSYLPLDSAGV